MASTLVAIASTYSGFLLLVMPGATLVASSSCISLLKPSDIVRRMGGTFQMLSVHEVFVGLCVFLFFLRGGGQKAGHFTLLQS